MTQPLDAGPKSCSEITTGNYQKLYQIARNTLRRSHTDDTLGTTALLHEAYLQMANKNTDFKDANHFLGLSATVMREVLVDHARKRCAIKRGSGAYDLPFEEDFVGSKEKATALLAMDDALKSLSKINPRLTQVVECRFFAGFDEEETAQALGLSLRTVQRDWKRAKVWLHKAVKGKP